MVAKIATFIDILSTLWFPPVGFFFLFAHFRKSNQEYSMDMKYFTTKLEGPATSLNGMFPEFRQGLRNWTSNQNESLVDHNTSEIVPKSFVWSAVFLAFISSLFNGTSDCKRFINFCVCDPTYSNSVESFTWVKPAGIWFTPTIMSVPKSITFKNQEDLKRIDILIFMPLWEDLGN